MSNRDEHDGRADVDAPVRETWQQRHGTALLLAGFVLLTIVMVVFEKLDL
jgi:hypothetical protein